MAPDPSGGQAWRRALPSVWQELKPFVMPVRWQLVAISVYAASLSLLVMPVLWLIKSAFDRAIPQGDVTLLLQIGAAVVAIRLATMGASLMLRWQVIRVVKRIVLSIRTLLLERVYERAREGLSRTEADRLHGRIVQESERLDVFCNAMLSSVLPAVCTALALAVFLAAQSPMLVVVAAVVVPALWGAGRLTQRGVANAVERFQAAFEVFNKGVSFVVRQIDLTRTQGHEREEISRQRGHIEKLSEAGRRMSMSYAVHGQSQTLVTGVAGILLLVFGGWQVVHGRLTLGELLVFYVGASMLNSALGTVSRSSAEIIAARVSIDKLAVLLAPSTSPAYRGTREVDFGGNFQLRDVRVAFDSQQVLAGVDLDLRAGQRIAIIGPNGSGKSTLLNVLLGMIRPTAGQAFADGHAYDHLDISALRRQIGVVTQRSAFFFGSVFENVTYGYPAATLAEVRSAAELAGAADFVETLPLGYNTPIGDGGQALSGGECQRLAVARALLRRPRALILDEPTNHLDVSSVRELMRRLAALPQAPTIILVSHDQRVLALVDRTYRMERGRLEPIVEAVAGAALDHY